MVLIYEFGLFQVELYNDEIYSRDSADNKYKYDFYYFNSLDEDSLSSKCAVRVLKDEKVYRSAILIAGGGGKTSVHQNAALIDGQNLIDILGDSIFSLNLPDLGLNWCLKCEDSVCLGLYQIPNGYLIHGEQSITKVNQKGKLIGSFMEEIFL